MGKDIYQAIPLVRDLYQKANQVLDFDLAKICFEGPQQVLDRTDVCQPALFVTSLALWNACRIHGGIDAGSCRFAAGLSLGEYTALTFAEAISFEDGLRLVQKRGRYMQACCDRVPGGMASIIGLGLSSVKEACEKASSLGCVGIANINAPGQIVISGEKRALHEAIRICKELGARRTIELQVAGAYHSELMRDAQDQLELDLAQIQITRPRIPIVANLNARPVTEPSEIRYALARQIVSSVLWEDSIKAIIERGIRTFYEFGPGQVLIGLARKIAPDLKLYSIEKISDLGRPS